jgi:hypothetical protein
VDVLIGHISSEKGEHVSVEWPVEGGAVEARRIRAPGILRQCGRAAREVLVPGARHHMIFLPGRQVSVHRGYAKIRRREGVSLDQLERIAI